MKNNILIISLLCVSTFSYANNTVQQNNNQNENVNLTQKEVDEINQKLSEDKDKLSKIKNENTRRDKVIVECGKLFDTSFSDESLIKVKSCLNSNNGMFPVEQQLSNAQSLDKNKPISPTPVINNSNTASTVVDNKKSDTSKVDNKLPVENKKQTVHDALQGVLR